MQTKDLALLVKNLGGEISKNSPTILTGVSVAGLITTTILAVRATPKAIQLLDSELNYLQAQDETREVEELSKKDVVRLTWRLYLPATVVGLATIFCMISANHISLRRNAALVGLYGITEAAFKEYQAKVVETLGKSKELKIRDEIAADRIKNNPPGTAEVIFTGKGEVLCYDSLSGRYFKSDIEKIRKAVNSLNRDLLSDMFLTLNEFYYSIGLAGTKLGEELGWDVDKGLIELSFSTQLTEDGEPCLVLNYDVTPKFI